MTKAQPGTPLQWLKDHVNHSDKINCLLWPFHVRPNGYGGVRFNGPQSNSHRTMLILAKGEPPMAGMHAAHSCGVKLCCNPNHLRWATVKENKHDQIVHGTWARGERVNTARLTAEQVEFIRRSDLPAKEIATLFGMHWSSIYSIRRGDNWKHLQSNARAAAK